MVLLMDSTFPRTMFIRFIPLLCSPTALAIVKIPLPVLKTMFRLFLRLFTAVQNGALPINIALVRFLSSLLISLALFVSMATVEVILSPLQFIKVEAMVALTRLHIAVLVFTQPAILWEEWVWACRRLTLVVKFLLLMAQFPLLKTLWARLTGKLQALHSPKVEALLRMAILPPRTALLTLVRTCRFRLTAPPNRALLPASIPRTNLRPLVSLGQLLPDFLTMAVDRAVRNRLLTFSR